MILDSLPGASSSARDERYRRKRPSHSQRGEYVCKVARNARPWIRGDNGMEACGAVHHSLIAITRQSVACDGTGVMSQRASSKRQRAPGR